MKISLLINYNFYTKSKVSPKMLLKMLEESIEKKKMQKQIIEKYLQNHKLTVL